MGPVQAASLELLRLVDETCRAAGLRYTLIGETLVGLTELGGFLPSLPYVEVALLYDAYVVLLDALRRKVSETDAYYLLDAQNCTQYDAPSTRLMKRSRVRLPEARQADETYYDYFLTIHPIYYAGDQKREYQAMARAMDAYREILDARLISRDVIRVKYWLKAIRMRRLCAKRQPDTLARMIRRATQYTQPTQYVYLPGMDHAQGPAPRCRQFQQVQDDFFCGVRCMRITQARAWVAQHYTPDRLAALVNAPEIPLRSMGPEARRALQLVQFEMLCELDRLCTRHQIRYAIAFGTVLGAMRHGGIIPWDDDIDVVMPYEEYVRFIEVARRELDPGRYFLRLPDTDPDCNVFYAQLKRQGTVFIKKNYERFDTHPGIFLDIFPLFNGPGNWIAHCLRAAVCRYYRVALWAHMGADSVSNPFWRIIYRHMAKMGNQTAYAKFMKHATAVRRDHGLLMFMGGVPSRIPYNVAYVRKSAYEHMEQITLEGRRFSVAHHREETMRFFYGPDFMRFPPLDDRFTARIDGALDLGGLYACPEEI